MAKRKDIRIALDPSLERLVVKAADAEMYATKRGDTLQPS